MVNCQWDDTMGACNTASQGHEQTTLDTFFVPASEIGNTDKALLKEQLDLASEDYDSKFRNFPRGKTLSKHIFDTIKEHQGITTKELIHILDLPKTTVYDHDLDGGNISKRLDVRLRK